MSVFHRILEFFHLFLKFYFIILLLLLLLFFASEKLYSLSEQRFTTSLRASMNFMNAMPHQSLGTKYRWLN